MASKFIMYLRKSTESEDKQQLSLDGQADALRKLANKHKLQIMGEPIREARSARKPGREQFTEMMSLLASGKADGILCWHLNRLARNPLDGGSIMWQLSERVIKEIRTPNATYVGTPDDRLMMSIIFGMATKRSDDIVRDVKRGIVNTLEAGKWPNAPKMGYVRDHVTKEIRRDPERWENMREIWRLKLSGMPTMEIYRRARDEWGLTSPPRGKVGGGLIKPAQIYRTLHDPFYAGLMEMSGKRYPGRHEAMVTLTEFERVQDSFRSNSTLVPRPQKHDFRYRGMLRCGQCNSQVTMQYTTNPQGRRYVYYFCCRKNKKYNFCSEKAVRETVIDSAVATFLESLSLSPAVEKVVVGELQAFEMSRLARRKQLREQQVSELQRIEARLVRLRSLLVDDLLSAEEYAADRELLWVQRTEIERQQVGESLENDKLIEHFREGVSLLRSAKSRFESASPKTQREMLRVLISNFSLKAKTPLIEAKFPFEQVRSGRINFSEYSRLEDVQTLLREMNSLRTLFLKDS